MCQRQKNYNSDVMVLIYNVKFYFFFLVVGYLAPNILIFWAS